MFPIKEYERTQTEVLMETAHTVTKVEEKCVYAFDAAAGPGMGYAQDPPSGRAPN